MPRCDSKLLEVLFQLKAQNYIKRQTYCQLQLLLTNSTFIIQTMVTRNCLFLFLVLAATSLAKGSDLNQPLLKPTEPQNFNPINSQIMNPFGDDIDVSQLSPQSAGDNKKLDHPRQHESKQEASNQTGSSFFNRITALWHYLLRQPAMTPTPISISISIPPVTAQNHSEEASPPRQQPIQQKQRNLISSTTIQRVGYQKNQEVLTSEAKKPQQAISLPTMSHKQNKRKYFILGTIVFGLIAMALVRVIKNKEEESEDFHRSGMLVPLEENEGDHQ